MRFTVIATLLETVLSVSAYAALEPRASGSPTCTYECPPKDVGQLANFTHKTSGTTLTCYFHLEGAKDKSRYCNYDTKTGDLTLGGDHDGIHCPKIATKGICSSHRKRDNAQLDAYKAKVAAHAAQPSPTHPQYMNERVALGRRKPLTRRGT